jgi:hypothetical protein
VQQPIFGKIKDGNQCHHSTAILQQAHDGIDISKCIFVLNAKNYEVWPTNWEILFDVVGDLCGFSGAGLWFCQTGSCEGQKYRL